ncbi:MAG: hypothetical protein BRC33_05965 [Cyanobacteria bacterium SW_9_44_58]|nr:MAG: hypothetical protein BRC33_05965 [Cyanobacteria bacterium SW_9_44_58]
MVIPWSLRITQLIESAVNGFNINFLINPQREEHLFPFFLLELEFGETSGARTSIGNLQKTTVKNYKIILRQPQMRLTSG